MTLVLLAAGTGLRMSELFGLKWSDVHFDRHEISVTRSIVMQVVGPCKTEASQRPIPMDHSLAEALEVSRAQSHYRADGDSVFASAKLRGRLPYWGQPIMRKGIRPVAITMDVLLHEWKSDLIRIWIPMIAGASLLVGMFGGIEIQGCRDSASPVSPTQSAVPAVTAPQPKASDRAAESRNQQVRSHERANASIHPGR
jgi:hypothetical protein